MERSCIFCGRSLADGDEVCPNCGTPVSRGAESAPDSVGRRDPLADGPRSLDELKAYCRAHRLSPEALRFSIGRDSAESRVTGIFREPSGDFVVFRNKGDGSRLELYRGTDEASAVRVFFPRLQDALARQRSGSGRAAASRSSASVRRQSGCLTRPLLLVILLIILFSLVFTFFDRSPSKGYYRYNEVYYYCDDGDWYYYSTSMLSWIPLAAPEPELADNAREYFESSVYRSSFPVPDFEDHSLPSFPPEGGAEPGGPGSGFGG